MIFKNPKNTETLTILKTFLLRLETQISRDPKQRKKVQERNKKYKDWKERKKSVISFRL
jgi:hypothetical protein